MRRFAIALVHHPVLDQRGDIVTSALTNIDVHDLARSARTYECSDFFVVHPIEAQRTMVARIVDHWTHGSSAKRIPDRKDALALVRSVVTLADAVKELGDGAQVWTTAARELERTTSFTDARSELETEGPPVLLVFGTGWGLAPAITTAADVRLEPIAGVAGWNHLSVRAACAIALDRLRGRRPDEARHRRT